MSSRSIRAWPVASQSSAIVNPTGFWHVCTIVIIIHRLQSSCPQVSCIDGGLGPFPTFDCHLASYQDPSQVNEYNNLLVNKVRCLLGFFLPWVGTYIANSLMSSISGKWGTWPRKRNCWSLTLSIRGAVCLQVTWDSDWFPLCTGCSLASGDRKILL